MYSNKATPTLTGRHALKFEKAVREGLKRKVPEADYRRAMKVYQSIKLEGEHQ